MRPVHVAGIGLWTPGYPSPRAWLEGRHDPAAVRPTCALLDSRIGRYTSLVTRMAVEAMEQAAPQAYNHPLYLPASGSASTGILYKSAAGHWISQRANPTFAVKADRHSKALCFQQAAPKGLHYIFSVGRGSSVRAVIRGGGWFGKVNLR